MAGSIFGTSFCISTWGESHGKGVGVVVDGCPAGIELSEEDIQVYLDRRAPGKSKFTTARKESDTVHIMSGVFDGKTTGTPISMIVYNEDQRSRDYEQVKNNYRPGHADYTFDMKYGFRDYRGGGRSSGRETTARVAAGAVAAKMLSHLGISVNAYTAAIGPVSIDKSRMDFAEISNNPVNMPDATAAEQAAAFLSECMAKTDSAGGIIECISSPLPAGLGETVFDKLDALLGHALFSIGAVKGVEIGSGFSAAESIGSENNDNFRMKDGKVIKTTNNAGGILGGMSDGAPLFIRVAVKPTPSIASEQETVSVDGENVNLSVKGRHDPIIVPRAVVVVESMVNLVLADLVIRNAAAKIENLEKIYS